MPLMNTLSVFMDNVMRWRLDDLEMFCAVVETGGVTAAAAQLNVPKSTVSKVLARLEHDLALTLIARTSRVLRVTAEGRTFHRQAKLILDLAQDTDAMMQGMRAVPSGRVVLAAPPAFCREILAPQLTKFVKQYPEVRLDIVTTSRLADVSEGAVDLAVVVGDQSDSELKQKALMGGRLMWVSSPDYAKTQHLGALEQPDPRHIYICETRYALGPVALHISGWGITFRIPDTAMQVTDPLCVREAVAGGMGVSFLPERYCRGAIARGELIEIWTQATFDNGAARLAVVYSGSRILSPRNRAVLGFLEEICRTGT